MKKVKMKEVLDLLEGGKKSNPKNGDLFVMFMRGVGFIPGLVVKDNFKYGAERLCVIYLYNEISDEKSSKFILDKSNLIVPPELVTTMDWRAKGGFENVGSLDNSDMDVFPNHCFHDRLRRRYVDENNVICEKFEPCGIRSISNIGSVAIGIFKKLNPDVEVIE
ncbi:hypothetical protein BLA9940_03594 [Burkholderia aenigmatica]|uniref:Uncharacterized protein n=1 Tax=Burkholderia aenigmatica TaxID=2015348 RepID=A0ABY6XJW2_9BURK|nr:MULTISPECIES: hypothetical protein [Burkholderia]VWC51035.1 hypothetical protein BLA17378_00800 [Burkholderia aenigmatica]VWC64844.1 hypothetical protein BLA9940_03594 [Burkholderia aenigmatica]